MSLDSVLHFIPVIFGVLVIFNLIIVVHELGHFLAARWRGLVVEEFGVWFGKPLWRRKFNGVWYSLGTLPLGGFVKLPQLAIKTVEGESETPEEELPPIRPLDKIIVAFAGPLFSFLLALALACVVWKEGKPYRQEDNTTRIGYVVPGGPADQAGLKPGDKILSIDGRPVTKFSGPVDSIMWGIVSSEGEKIDFLIEREGQQFHLASGWTKEASSAWSRKPLRKILIAPLTEPEIGAVTPGGPGAAAGLQKGDYVTAVNGAPIIDLSQLAAAVQKTGLAPVNLTVRRNSQPLEVTVTPRDPKSGEDEFGLEWGSIRWDYPNPMQQVKESVQAIVNTFRAATSRKGDVKAQHMSGPLGIMNLYRRILQSEQPLQYAIAFSVFFNVNLALLNLVPLPVLDGGHITLGIIEMIRRRPVRNLRFMEIMETACTLLILGFILYVSFFDVGDIFPHKAPASTPPSAPAAK